MYVWFDKLIKVHTPQQRVKQALISNFYNLIYDTHLKNGI